MFQNKENTEFQDSEASSQKLHILWEFNDQLARSIFIGRWLGYGLLVFFIVDLMEVLIPANFTNPSWELQAFGEVIERIIIPLLALVLIFFGGRNLRSAWEQIPLRSLSYLAFLFGIVLFLLIPLTLFNTLRVERNNANQVIPQIDGQLSQIQQLRSQLERATTE